MDRYKNQHYQFFDGIRIVICAIILEYRYHVSIFKSYCQLMNVYWKYLTALPGLLLLVVSLKIQFFDYSLSMKSPFVPVRYLKLHYILIFFLVSSNIKHAKQKMSASNEQRKPINILMWNEDQFMERFDSNIIWISSIFSTNFTLR